MKKLPRFGRGAALVQVVLAVGVATVLGLSMLASSALHSQMGRSTDLAAGARGLAESGAQLAMHYLQNPHRAPAFSGDYWAGQSGMVISGMDGTVDVSVAREAGTRDEYLLRSTARPGKASFDRTIEARVKVEPGLQIKHAAISANDLIIDANTTISGNARIDGKLSGLGRVLGTAEAREFGTVGVIATQSIMDAAETVYCPAKETVNTYPTYVWSDGKRYSRTTLSSSTISGSLGATESNPAGIYYYDGNLTLGGLNLQGTLIVNGDVFLQGASMTIAAKEGFPALVVFGNIRSRSFKTLNVYGVTWVEKDIRSDSGSVCLSTYLRFYGALLFGKGGKIESAAATSVTVTYDGNRVTVPELDTSLTPSVRVLSWKTGK